MSARAHLREARPKQWVKNVLVFAAPGAAGVLNEWSALWPTLVAFVALCMAASGTYYWNDILDVEADRAHPRKRSRPIASGAVSMTSARLIGTILLLGGVAIAFVPDWRCGVAVSVYVALTVSYSVVLKHEPVLDLLARVGVLHRHTAPVGHAVARNLRERVDGEFADPRLQLRDLRPQDSLPVLRRVVFRVLAQVAVGTRLLEASRKVLLQFALLLGEVGLQPLDDR